MKNVLISQDSLTTMVDGIVVLPSFPFAQQVPVPAADMVETVQVQGSSSTGVSVGGYVDGP